MKLLRTEHQNDLDNILKIFIMINQVVSSDYYFICVCLIHQFYHSILICNVENQKPVAYRKTTLKQ